MPIAKREVNLTYCCKYCDLTITANGENIEKTLATIRLHGWTMKIQRLKVIAVCPNCRMAKQIIDLEHKIDMYKPGTQIVYIPDHTTPGTFNKDVEFGFVIKVKDNENIWCRYWAKVKDGEKLHLRTTANSELTPLRLLRIWSCTEDETVTRACAKWGIEL